MEGERGKYAELVHKQFAMAYAGHLGSITELDTLPVSEFELFYKVLERQMKEERTQRKKAADEARSRQRAAASRNRFALKGNAHG